MPSVDEEDTMKKALACVAALAWVGVMAACLPEGDEQEGEEAEGEEVEEVGQAQQAVGEGGLCGAGQGTCDSGLTCCGAGVFTKRCRNLQTDENNCGACGNDCDAGGPPGFPFTDWVCILGACHPVP